MPINNIDQDNVTSSVIPEEENSFTYILLNPSDVRLPMPPKPRYKKVLCDLFMLVNIRGVDSFSMWIDIWKQLFDHIIGCR